MYRPDTRSLAATALAVVATAGATAPAADAGTRARPADSFVESVGVNVHLGYTQSPYKRYDVVQEKLQKLGVRYVRDGLNPGQTQVYRAWRGLAKCGIKVNLIVGDPLQRWGIGPLASQLALIKKAEITDAIASLEGPNEYDNQGDRRWQSTLRRLPAAALRGRQVRPRAQALPGARPVVRQAREPGPAGRHQRLPGLREHASLPRRRGPRPRGAHALRARPGRQQLALQARTGDRDRLPQRTRQPLVAQADLRAGSRRLHAAPVPGLLPPRHHAHLLLRADRPAPRPATRATWRPTSGSCATTTPRSPRSRPSAG